jgi:hypothetical protein
MKNINEKIKTTDWQEIKLEMNEKGYAIVPKVITPANCQDLIKNFDHPGLYRKTVIMERHSYGMGEYKYYNYPLPEIIGKLRKEIYPQLAPIANNWMSQLKIERHFPEKFEQLQKLCHENNQTKPTPLILKYGKGGFNTLHQDLYGDIFFPIQVVLFLNDPEKDYSGGEFVLTQQKTRAQSKAIVLKPAKGDMLIFTTNFRPEKGKRGYHRVQMKHGISEVHEGNRHTVGIIFHDALK